MRARFGELMILLGLILWLDTAVAVDKVQVLALFPGKAMLSIDGKQRILANGETSPEGVKLVVATATRATVIFNDERRLLKLSSAVNTSYQQQRIREVRIMRDNTGAYRLNGLINGRLVRFLVDTGANVVAMSELEARRLSIPYMTIGTPATADTAAGMVQAWAVNLNTVTVGEIGLNNISAVVIKGSNPPQILLGMSFLGQLQIRHGKNLMTLSKR